MPTQMPDDDTMWVKSGLNADGTYGASLEVTADISIPLDEATTNILATHAEKVCAQAEFIAKAYKQLLAVGVPNDDNLLETVAEIRREIPEDRTVDHLPIRLKHGLTREGKPFIIVAVNGQDEGQLDVGPALNWASHLRSARHWSELDQMYYDLLVREYNLPSDTAHGTVAALSEINVNEPPPSNARRFYPDRLL